MSQENSLIFDQASNYQQEKPMKYLCSWMIARMNDQKPFFDPQKFGTTRKFGQRVITPQQKQQKFQAERQVAFSFIEHGVNYDSILQRYPRMPSLAYDCHLKTIHKNIINDIYCYLHNQLVLDVELITYDEMHDIYNQLLEIKDWFGYADLNQLEAYYSFIRRRYDKSVCIDQESAVKLYKTILRIAKKPEYEQMEDQELDAMNMEMWSQLQFY